MQLQDLSISRKLAVAFALLMALLLLESSIVAFDMRQLQQTSRQSARSEATADAIAAIAANLIAQENSARGYAASHSRVFALSYAYATRAVEEGIAAVRLEKANVAKPSSLSALMATVQAFQSGHLDRMMRLAASSSTSSQALVLAGEPAPNQIDLALRALGVEQRRLSNQIDADEAREEQGVFTALITGGAVALAAAMFLRRTLTRVIADPLIDLIGPVQKLAAGDTEIALTASVRHDEIGTLQRALMVFRQTAVDKALSDIAAEASLRERMDSDARHAATQAAAAADQQRCIAAIASALGHVAEGDLTVRLSGLPVSFEALQHDFNRSIEALEAALRVVVDGSRTIESEAALLRTASQELSASSTTQASRLEAASRAVQTITTSVRSTADGASRTNDVVAGARAEAERSREAIVRMAAAMEMIAKSTHEVVGLAELIDRIAGETGTIALNARIEAARVGQTSASFGVVALEVGALAQRTARAAATIKQRIEASGQQVTDGVHVVGEAGDAFQSVIDRVGIVGELMLGIHHATGDQAEQVAAINQSVASLGEMTRRNAAMAVEAQSATGSLAYEADALAQASKRFRIAARIAA